MDDMDERYNKKNPFSVPPGYFEQLTDQVIDRVKKTEKPQKVRFMVLIRPYVGLAAIFLIALFVVQVILPHFIDERKMLKRENGETVVAQENVAADEVQLDSNFNPSSDEILEYLSTEVSDYELIYAELY